MEIHEVMTSNPECVDPSLTLREAARRMVELDVGALPVCGPNDKLIGMLTDRDIVVNAVAEGLNPDQAKVQDAMHEGVVYCFEDENVTAAAEKMASHQIRRLGVLNRDKRLVGILSLGDVATSTGDTRISGEVLEKVSS